MKAPKLFVVSGMAAVVMLLLALTVGLTTAQGPDQLQGTTAVTAPAPGAIPIQGRLTNASGASLNGTYTMTFRLYDDAAAAIALCADVRQVLVTNGLFSDYMDHCSNDITGQKLWLGIQVGSDAEMTPRQVIYPVPYAVSLVPGAVISTAGYPALHVESTNPSGRGLRAYASATSGTNYGIVGASSSPSGYGGYFYDQAGGVGVYGRGNPGVLGEGDGSLGANGVVGRASAIGAGVKGEGDLFAYGGWFTSTAQPALRAESDSTALQLAGSGRIESTADSYIFVPGSALVRQSDYDSTRWDMNARGSAYVWRGESGGGKTIYFPIVVPSVLYGQAVTIKSVTIYYRCDNGTNNYIAGTGLTKQADDPPGYTVLVNDATDRTSNVYSNYTLTPTTHNVLSRYQGILVLRLTLEFVNDTEHIEIGGVRVQLGHQ